MTEAFKDPDEASLFPAVAREDEIDQDSPDAAVAILERVDGLEPQVRQGSTDEAFVLGVLIAPVEQPKFRLIA
jgi:hypothetical protein